MRPFHRHIDKHELNALVPTPSEARYELLGPTPDELREAERHVALCVECNVKVSKYRRLVNRSLHDVPTAATPGVDCPKEDDVDWHEVATGQWPELKATQLMMHAALCDHCGPLLRAAVSVDDAPTLQPLAEPKALLRPARMRWLIPAVALLIIIGLLTKIPSTPSTSLSASKFAEFAVNTHRQHTQGRLALDVLSDSQQTVNEWFKAKLQYHLALPAAPAVPGEERPYRLEGARLVPVGGTTAAYISYNTQPGAASQFQEGKFSLRDGRRL